MSTTYGCMPGSARYAGPYKSMVAFRNASDLTFVNIASEKERRYYWGDEGVIVIDEPYLLHVGDSGHRIFTKDGTSMFIPYGWKAVAWTVHDGEPHFVL